jgi:hypothetical protein
LISLKGSKIEENQIKSNKNFGLPTQLKNELQKTNHPNHPKNPLDFNEFIRLFSMKLTFNIPPIFYQTTIKILFQPKTDPSGNINIEQHIN